MSAMSQWLYEDLWTTHDYVEISSAYGRTEPTPHSAAWGEAMRELLAIDNSFVQRIVTLHWESEEFPGYCETCEPRIDNSLIAQWPCETIEAVAAQNGIEIPSLDQTA
ncbi:MAG: hypothetical protein ABIO14_12550 [Aeromicrobium sp.]